MSPFAMQGNMYAMVDEPLWRRQKTRGESRCPTRKAGNGLIREREVRSRERLTLLTGNKPHDLKSNSVR